IIDTTVSATIDSPLNGEVFDASDVPVQITLGDEAFGYANVACSIFDNTVGGSITLPCAFTGGTQTFTPSLSFGYAYTLEVDVSDFFNNFETTPASFAVIGGSKPRAPR